MKSDYIEFTKNKDYIRDLSNKLFPQVFGRGLLKDALVLMLLSDNLTIFITGDRKTGKTYILNLFLELLSHLKKQNSSLLHNKNFKIIKDLTIFDENVFEKLIKQNRNIIAIGNVINQKFDLYTSWNKQVGVSPKIFSEFDLFFAFKDIPDVKMDSKIALSMLKNTPVNLTELDFAVGFLEYANSFNSTFSKEAEEKLIKFYAEFRSSTQDEQKDTEPVRLVFTLKQYETLIKLSKAYAKLELSQTINENHVQMSIDFLIMILERASINIKTGEIDIQRVMVSKEF